MKILLTSDIHACPEWFSFLSKQEVDLIAIAGDLIECPGGSGDIVQMVSVTEVLKTFRSPVALCSGNHDTFEGIHAKDLSSLTVAQCETVLKIMTASSWFDVLESPRVLSDGRAAFFHGLVVTTHPYNSQKEELFKQGQRLRASKKVPWLCLHHEPAVKEGSRWLSQMANEYAPDFVLSGHMHRQPYVGSFAQKQRGNSWFFNAGNPDKKTPTPNFILLDTESKKAVWMATVHGEPDAVFQGGVSL